MKKNKNKTGEIEVLDDNPSSLKKSKSSKILRGIGILLFKVFFMLVVVYILFFHICGVYRLSTNEMHPTIAKGNLILYYRLDKDYHVGDVVTYVKDGQRYVSRIVGMEYETISINENNEITNNKSYLEKQILFKDKIPDNSKIKYPYNIPKHSVYVLGDYRLDVNDSRTFGAIDTDLIDGKVISFLQTRDI